MCVGVRQGGLLPLAGGGGDADKNQLTKTTELSSSSTESRPAHYDNITVLVGVAPLHEKVVTAPDPCATSSNPLPVRFDRLCYISWVASAQAP